MQTSRERLSGFKKSYIDRKIGPKQAAVKNVCCYVSLFSARIVAVTVVRWRALGAVAQRRGKRKEWGESENSQGGTAWRWALQSAGFLGPKPHFLHILFYVTFSCFFIFLKCNYSYVFLFLLSLGKSFQASKNQEFLSRTISCCKHFQVGYL